MALPTTPIGKTPRSRLKKLSEEAGLTRAIQSGEVDAVVMLEKGEPHVYRIRSDEPLYRTMIESMSVGVASVLTDGTIVYANEHLMTMAGADAELHLGSSLLPCVAAAEQPLFTAMLRRALETPQELEVLFRWKSEEGPVLVSARRLPIPDAEVTSSN